MTAFWISYLIAGIIGALLMFRMIVTYEEDDITLMDCIFSFFIILFGYGIFFMMILISINNIIIIKKKG
jgi:hypothetical protein